MEKQSALGHRMRVARDDAHSRLRLICCTYSNLNFSSTRLLSNKKRERATHICYLNVYEYVSSYYLRQRGFVLPGVCLLSVFLHVKKLLIGSSWKFCHKRGRTMTKFWLQINERMQYIHASFTFERHLDAGITTDDQSNCPLSTVINIRHSWLVIRSALLSISVTLCYSLNSAHFDCASWPIPSTICSSNTHLQTCTDVDGSL